MLLRNTGKISENFHLLTFGETCCYLHAGEEGLSLFDCGGTAHNSALIKRLYDLKLGDKPIINIFVTQVRACRMAGINLLLARNPNCQLHLPRLDLDLEACAKIIEEDRQITALYQKGTPKVLPKPAVLLEQVSQARLPNSKSNLKLGTDFSVQGLSFPGNAESAYCYYIPELQFLVADLGIGLFRGRETPAPMADFNIAQLLESQQRLSDLPLSYLGLPYFGVISGDLIQKFLNDSRTALPQLQQEFNNALKAGVSRTEALNLIEESLFTSNSKDPIISMILKNSFAELQKQL